MAKVHKSLRINEDIAAAVAKIANEGETEASAYNRVLAAGVAAMRSKGKADEDQQPEEQSERYTALVDSLRDHIETLKTANESLKEQVTVKDEQITTKDAQIKAKDEQLSAKDEQLRALSVLTAQAQELHGAAVTKAIDQPRADDTSNGNQDGEKHRSWWARLWS